MGAAVAAVAQVLMSAILPCKERASALEFAAYVNTMSECEASGREVIVKTTAVTAPTFLEMIVMEAVERGWSNGAEMPLALADFLATL